MFSEYSGSLNGRNAYDKGFLIAIQAKRYKVFFSTSMSYLLMNVLFCTIYADDLDFIDVKYNYKR